MNYRRRSRPRSIRSRAGFTLMEIMIALTVGAMAVGSIYTMGKNSTHFFQQQYRVSNTMTRLRLAMVRVKRDLQRAGYLASRNANGPSAKVCGPTNVTPNATAYAGIMRLTSGVGDTGTDNGMDPGGNYANLPADTLWMLGNYQTSSEYPGLNNPSGDGVRLELDQWWHAFRQDFTLWHDDTTCAAHTFDEARFERVFSEGRPVRIMTADRRAHFATVQSVQGPADIGRPVRFTITPAVPTTCRGQIKDGWIAPLQLLEYRVESVLGSGAAQTVSEDANDPERYPQLHRREIDIGSGNAVDGGEDSVVLEYVVAFDVNFIASNGANPPTINWATPQNNAFAPHNLRMARVTLAARSPGIDRTFPQDNPPNAAPFRRFILVPGALAPGYRGSARVRRLRADVFLPNMTVQ